MPTWLLLSLSAAFVWTIAPVLAKKGFVHISSLWNNIFANFFVLVVWVPAVLLLSHGKLSLPTFPVILALIAAGGAYMFFFYAIAKADISLTSPLSALYPISAVILSFMFLHERITIVQTVGIVVAVAGVFLIALPGKNLTKVLHMKDKSWLWWGLFSAIVSGSGDFLSKYASNSVGAYSQIFYAALVAQGLSVVNFLLDKKGRKLPKFSLNKFLPTLLGTLFSIVGMLLFFIAFRYGKASLVVPVSSTYPALVVVFAALFLGERISRRQMVGVACITLGVMLIGVGL